MARPIKNNADYFPHDAHMRNDPRILALRRKHGLPGYAVYVMTIEAMSNANHFRLDVSLVGREIMAGDFGIDESTLDTILRYCVQIDLFQLSDDVLTCNSLNKRFESLINRRVSDAETIQKPAETQQEPYSKVKKSKVKERIEEEMNTYPQRPEYSYALSFAKIFNKPYPKERGMRGEGQDIDMILAQLDKSRDWIAQAKALRKVYDQEGWSMPTNPATIVTSLLGTDWVERLKDSDPEHKAERKANGNITGELPALAPANKPGALDI